MCHLARCGTILILTKNCPNVCAPAEIGRVGEIVLEARKCKMRVRLSHFCESLDIVEVTGFIGGQKPMIVYLRGAEREGCRDPRLLGPLCRLWEGNT